MPSVSYNKLVADLEYVFPTQDARNKYKNDAGEKRYEVRVSAEKVTPDIPPLFAIFNPPRILMNDGARESYWTEEHTSAVNEYFKEHVGKDDLLFSKNDSIHIDPVQLGLLVESCKAGSLPAASIRNLLSQHGMGLRQEELDMLLGDPAAFLSHRSREIGTLTLQVDPDKTAFKVLMFDCGRVPVIALTQSAQLPRSELEGLQSRLEQSGFPVTIKTISNRAQLVLNCSEEGIESLKPQDVRRALTMIEASAQHYQRVEARKEALGKYRDALLKHPASLHRDENAITIDADKRTLTLAFTATIPLSEREALVERMNARFAVNISEKKPFALAADGKIVLSANANPIPHEYLTSAINEADRLAFSVEIAAHAKTASVPESGIGALTREGERLYLIPAPSQNTQVLAGQINGALFGNDPVLGADGARLTVNPQHLSKFQLMLTNSTAREQLASLLKPQKPVAHTTTPPVQPVQPPTPAVPTVPNAQRPNDKDGKPKSNPTHTPSPAPKAPGGWNWGNGIGAGIGMLAGLLFGGFGIEGLLMGAILGLVGGAAGEQFKGPIGDFIASFTGGKGKGEFTQVNQKSKDELSTLTYKLNGKEYTLTGFLEPGGKLTFTKAQTGNKTCTFTELTELHFEMQSGKIKQDSEKNRKMLDDFFEKAEKDNKFVAAPAPATPAQKDAQTRSAQPDFGALGAGRLDGVEKTVGNVVNHNVLGIQTAGVGTLPSQDRGI